MMNRQEIDFTMFRPLTLFGGNTGRSSPSTRNSYHIHDIWQLRKRICLADGSLSGVHRMKFATRTRCGAVRYPTA